MTEKLLDCVEITTSTPAEYTVIWLHGLGASGHDFEPVVPALELLHRPGVRFLFPHAPVRPITINGGAAMRGWYDIMSMDIGDRGQDQAGITESADAVDALIAHEAGRGVPSNRIILAGFSQGGAIALYAGLRNAEPLAGILALSTYFPLQDEVLPTLDESRKTLPVFMAHGQQDTVINIAYAEQSRDVMKANGIDVEWHDYAIEHSVSADEVADISTWLKRQFGM